MRYCELESKVLDEVETRLDLPDVSLLSIEDIERCRAELPAFRQKLVEKTTGRLDPLYADQGIDDATSDLLDEFFETTTKYKPRVVRLGGRSRVLPGEILSEGIWDVSQVVLAPVIALKYAKLFFEWRRKGRAMTPLLLLLDVRHGMNATRGRR
jgi:hypothetical protein